MGDPEKRKQITAERVEGGFKDERVTRNVHPTTKRQGKRSSKLEEREGVDTEHGRRGWIKSDKNKND
jgi:hypothetical protein